MKSFRLNVILPAHNEAATIGASIKRVAQFLDSQDWDWELVIAENGSRDRTADAAEAVAREARPGRGGIRVVRCAEPGRGRALRTTWLHSEADILSYLDVDLSTDLEDFGTMVEFLRRDEADLVIGSRLAEGARTIRSWRRECLSRGYNGLLHMMLRFRIRDAQCGCKAISREAAKALLPLVRDEGWFFDTELVWRAERGGWRVQEVPVTWVENSTSTVRFIPTIWQDLQGIWRLWREGRNGLAPNLTKHTPPG